MQGENVGGEDVRKSRARSGKAFRIADRGLRMGKTQRAKGIVHRARKKPGLFFHLFPAKGRSYVSFMVWGEGIISPQADLSAEGEIAEGPGADSGNSRKIPI